MSGLQEYEQDDRTDTDEFIYEHANRLLAWEVVHTAYAADTQLYPSRIAEGCGLPLRTVYDILNIKG